MKSYKILVPKPAAMDESGNTVGLYAADDVVTPSGDWQKQIMDTFVENGWAMEIKAIKPEETVIVEADVTVAEEKAEEPEEVTENGVNVAEEIPKQEEEEKKCEGRREKRKGWMDGGGESEVVNLEKGGAGVEG